MGKNAWTEEETRMAFALYWLLPQKDYRASCPDVVNLSGSLGRTANAVKMKIENLKRGDPHRQMLGQRGLPNGAELELVVWEKFFEQGDTYLDGCLDLLEKALGGKPSSPEIRYALVELPPVGRERSTIRNERVNQQYFRNSLLRNYEGRCCITGLPETSLLVASHIKPWSISNPTFERLAASNGLLLNALHDKAFDKGLITISQDYKVLVSSKLKSGDDASDWLLRFKGEPIRKPLAMPPAKEFIEYHNDVVFVA